MNGNSQYWIAVGVAASRVTGTLSLQHESAGLDREMLCAVKPNPKRQFTSGKCRKILDIVTTLRRRMRRSVENRRVSTIFGRPWRLALSRSNSASSASRAETWRLVSRGSRFSVSRDRGVSGIRAS